MAGGEVAVVALELERVGADLDVVLLLVKVEACQIRNQLMANLMACFYPFREICGGVKRLLYLFADSISHTGSA